MKKVQWLWWVNVLLLVAVAIQIITVVFHDQMPRQVFAPIHIWCGRALLTLAVVHLILNWNWVKSNLAGFLGKHR